MRRRRRHEEKFMQRRGLVALLLVFVFLAPTAFAGASNEEDSGVLCRLLGIVTGLLDAAQGEKQVQPVPPANSFGPLALPGG
jgi:hypothetical protein